MSGLPGSSVLDYPADHLVRVVLANLQGLDADDGGHVYNIILFS